MTIEDRIIEVQVELLRLEAGSRREILSLFEELRRELVAAVRGAELTDSPRPGVRAARLERLLKDIDEILRLNFGKIGSRLSDDLAAISGHTVAQAGSAINTIAGAELMEPTLTKATLRSIANESLVDGAPIKEWLDVQRRTLRQRFLREMRKGIATNDSVSQLVQRLVGGKDHPGILSISRREATALVRTSVINMSNQARIAAYQQSPDFNGLRWVSTLDERTTPICRALDGLEWDRNLKPIGHKFPFPGATAHWNCRSTQVPRLASYKDLVKSESFAEALEKWRKTRDRASKTGPVQASTTYEGWLKRQPVSVQKRVLGESRWEVWKKGRLSFSDMVDQTGRPLRLDELGIRR